ncbi:hypothetical protein KC340_g18388 [Hortaea werneckii]|nr:hypothetical protein KC342_g4607 [Hortaea werneckii]KAI7102292.1 hypothetical protein KC339_g6116 [Hortaea werneckii]KAI7243422.1 hypothetical protein KC365_g2318 [Hortaea werneckii]KAI7285042.1 hypothetical protein KC340_g18388 [Hortaea werneckii]KAI7369327.1 hypothetical protein KC328_g17982 [Hortaea werneckii]
MPIRMSGRVGWCTTFLGMSCSAAIAVEESDVDWTLDVGDWVLYGLKRCRLGGRRTRSFRLLSAILASHTFSLADFAVPPPSFRTFLSLLLFILASGFQHDCHAYLCSLKSPSSSTTTTTNAAANKDNDPSSSSGKPKDSYQLPTHPAFTHLIVPHYTAECLLYLSLAFLAAPAPQPQSPTRPSAGAQAAGRGSVFNYTLLAAGIFVVVNLGVTAQGTREWYLVRFGGSREGRELVERRWRLVPGVW